MICTRYDFDKSLQATSRFLKNYGGSLNYTKLLKLLYLADREAMKISERSITGDSYYSMKQGPILSNVYDLIRGVYWECNEQNIWKGYINKQRYNLTLINDPGVGDLSEFEIEIIDRLSEQFKAYNFCAMIKYCHDNLPEWTDPGETSALISKESIFISLGKSNDEIESIREELESIESLKEVLGE